jgi:NAD(P)-dependent dehydrogenase (short-subunit alcohol dehydrogenase family)
MIAHSIESAGGGVCVLQADLAEPGKFADLIATANAALGSFGLLVNNASVFEFPATSMAASFFGQSRDARRARAGFCATGAEAGSNAPVVNIIDQRVWRRNPLFFTYTLSKSRLSTATQIMA